MSSDIDNDHFTTICGIPVPKGKSQSLTRLPLASNVQVIESIRDMAIGLVKGINYSKKWNSHELPFFNSNKFQNQCS